MANKSVKKYVFLVFLVLLCMLIGLLGYVVTRPAKLSHEDRVKALKQPVPLDVELPEELR